jgi:hypothetical protein
MRTRPYLALGLAASFAALTAAADPPDPGKVTWAKGYPKSVAAKPSEIEGAVVTFGDQKVKADGVVAVSGDYELKPGWVVKEVQFYVSPKAGGSQSEITKLNLGTGQKWGALDPKDKTKVVPARLPLPKGEWAVCVVFQFEGKDAAGKPATVAWMAALKYVEIK